MDNIYRAEIIDHYKNPRNFGPPPPRLREGDRIIIVKEANASCGDMIEMGIRLKIENWKLKIDEIKFRNVGCAISTAAGSLLTEAVNGKTINEVKKFSEKNMMALLGIEVSPTRMKCATLPLRALQKALSKIEKAVAILKSGGVIIFPTDTVWGMGVAADNPAAVKKFYRIKRREKDKPTAILVADLAQAERWGEFDDKARKIAEKFWPGALTLIVSNRKTGNVGLRVPNYPIIQELCQRVGGILAGSANFAGERAPMKREEINRELGNKVDLVMEGECGGQEASTVVDTTVKPWRVIRQGTVVIR